MLKIIRNIVIFGILLGLIGAAFVTIAVTKIYPTLPALTEIQNYQPKLPIQIFAEDGSMLGQFGEEHRIFIPIAKTPEMLKDAILSAEDERFYEHQGFDYIGFIRSALNNVLHMSFRSGGSTITMQVARNFFLSSQKTITRKFNEILLSYKIEKYLTKDQILELYINQIYLGQRAYGFGEAAYTYFGKPLDKLSIAEYAMLAGMPKAPSTYNPVANLKRATERQHYVLDRMYTHKYITKEEYNQALQQTLIITKGAQYSANDAGSYVAEMVRQYLYPIYGNSIYSQGFKVYTTIDSKQQQAAYSSLRSGIINYDQTHGYRGAEDYFDMSNIEDPHEIADKLSSVQDYGNLLAAIVTKVNTDGSINATIKNGQSIAISPSNITWVKTFINNSKKTGIKPGALIRVINQGNNQYSLSQIPQVQGSLVSLDPNTGAIKSLVGGFDFAISSFNHVVQAYRQPGSSFKPFIYSAALDNGIKPSTIFDDSSACYPDRSSSNGQWCPRNDDNTFMGEITVRQALTKSRNAVTVKILDQITPKVAISYVNKFGFDKDQFQPYLTMALGANEATSLQMARAYAVFANSGYLITPYFIKKITDSAGNVLAETKIPQLDNSKLAIDPRNAFIMNSMLQDVARYGTGAAAYKALGRSDIAGKTGTTTDAKDVWFDGYTPDLVCVVWMGFDQPKSLGSKTYGANTVLPIWIDFMKSALKNKAIHSMPMPDGILIESNATWNGQTEYSIDGMSNANSESSSAIPTNDEDSTNSDNDAIGDQIKSISIEQGVPSAPDNGIIDDNPDNN